jgi:carbonyl reductase 1
LPGAVTIAAVTGANQGLGLAVAAGLRARLTGPDDVVYLTGRDPDRVATAAAGLAAAGLDVATHPLDVTDPGAGDRFAAMLRERHGGIDLLVSNAAARIVPDRPPAAQVREFAATNNLGTTRLLRAIVPLLRPGARLLVVASSFGTLRSLPPPLHARFDDPGLTLDGVDAVVRAWVDAVEGGTDAAEGWPDWINIPSKVGQVAALRVVARRLREDGPPGVLAVAVCPGLVDTAASRPWFDDMTEAQSPDEAATHLVRLALDPVDAGLHGELVQFGRVLPWR